MAAPITPQFSKEEVAELNKKFENESAENIIKWSIANVKGLFQTTAFGLSGLVILDITSRLHPRKNPVELIFIDTLHHFQETLDLVKKVETKYPNTNLHAYFPNETKTREEFAEKYGPALWESNDVFYDYLVKVEPLDRAQAELGVRAEFTGRRRSQGAARGSLPIIEVDESGIVKINPLANWSFAEVKEYVKEHHVPYNPLLDQGYKSVGDFHSTVPVGEGEDERSGRWKGQTKTECGIHDKGRFAELKKVVDAA